MTTTTAQPTIEITSVTPELAEKWMGKNVHNRTLSKMHVGSMARDMLADNWRLAAEPVKFSTDGTLLDGQHRLMAIIQSGCTVDLFVARGISAEAQHVMDTGRKRSAASALQLAGEKNSTALAAAVRLAIAIERGIDTKGFECTTAEINEFLSSNAGIREPAEEASRLSRRTGVPPSVITYTMWRFMDVDVQDAYEFWTAAAEKIGLVKGDPVIALTERYMVAARQREVLPQRAQVAMIFRAWNFRRAHRSMTQAKIMRGVFDLPVLK